MERIINIINKIPKPLKSKYILTLIFFAFWIIFVDDYSLIKQHQLQRNINDLEDQKEYYLSEINKDSSEFYHLENTKEEQEKFAREKFLMKKDNEDVFIIREKKNE